MSIQTPSRRYPATIWPAVLRNHYHEYASLILPEHVLPLLAPIPDEIPFQIGLAAVVRYTIAVAPTFSYERAALVCDLERGRSPRWYRALPYSDGSSTEEWELYKQLHSYDTVGADVEWCRRVFICLYAYIHAIRNTGRRSLYEAVCVILEGHD